MRTTSRWDFGSAVVFSVLGESIVSFPSALKVAHHLNLLAVAGHNLLIYIEIAVPTLQNFKLQACNILCALGAIKKNAQNQLLGEQSWSDEHS